MFPAALLAFVLLSSGICRLSSQEGSTDLTDQAALTYHVPYHLSETNHIMLRAKINGQGPFNFIMDTGAPAVFLSKTSAERCGVKSDATGWGTFDHLEVEGGVLLEKIKARIEEPSQLIGMNAMGLSSDHIDGVLGYNLLSQFRVQIDLTQSKMIWTRVDYTPEMPDFIGRLTQEMSHAQSAAFEKANKNVKQMEGVTQMLSAMYASPSAPKSIPRGFFGIELDDTAQGPRIREVLAQSPAALAGLKEGDLVVRMVTGDTPAVDTKTAAGVLRATSEVKAGESVLFVLRRGTQRIKIAMRAGKGEL